MSKHLAQRLLEQRANTWEQAKALLDTADAEERDLTAEENQSWARMMDDINVLDERRKAIEDAMASASAADAALRGLNHGEQVPGAQGSLDDEIRSWATGQGKRTLEARSDKPIGPNEFRVLSKLTAGAGANTVKVSFYDQLIAHMIEVSALLQSGPTPLVTTTGEQIQVPKTTAHSSAALTAEAGSISPSDPAFGQVPLDAYAYKTLFQLSNELLTDTSVDLTGYLAMQAGRAVGNAFGAHLVTGTGSSQPNGIVTAATLGVTGASGVAGAFTADNLIDLFYSVIAPYRNSQSCGWLVKDATMGAIRKLKDTTNQYLFAPSLTVGTPDTLLGKPIRTDPGVAAVALSAKSVVFGDFSQYFVRMVNGVRFERSDEFAFQNDLVTYRCVLRGDGDLIDTTGAVKYFAGNAA